LVKSGGLGFEGVDLELVDSTGKAVATARTDFDGFFLFERVAYGTYRLRVVPSSAESAKIATDLGVRLELTPERSLVRLGTIEARLPRQVADATPASPRPGALR
jgi:hypothetical protein